MFMKAQVITYKQLNNSNVMENSSELNRVFSNPSYSKNSKSQASSFADMNDPKKRYAAVIQQEKHHEREQLHRQLERQKHEEQKVYKKHLKAEINKRKKELQQLQREKSSGQEQHKKATYQAQLKKERDNIKRMEESMRNKTADQKSKTRYRAAKQRQKDIDQQINKKRIEANRLRKTHMRTEEAERAQAAKFSQSLLERQAKIQENKINNQRTAVEEYRKGLSLHGFSQKLINASKPVTLVFKENEEDGDALTKAQKQELRNSEKEKLRQEAQMKNRKIAEERGNEVLYKMQRQKEYEKYCKDAEQQQRKYNLRRLEAGKKNQYAGVKPMTLSQIDINKKLRSQKEFEKMFIQTATSTRNEPASKYKIVENKMVDVVVKPKNAEKWVKQPIDYADNQSLIPGVSEGHFSFQQQRSQDEFRQTEIEQKESSKKEMNVKPIIKESGYQQQAVDQTGKTRLKETRLSNEALRQELNYSDSEEDSNI